VTVELFGPFLPLIAGMAGIRFLFATLRGIQR